MSRATPPAEHCGNQLPLSSSGAATSECVLRPGHEGSHADEQGMRWWRVTPPDAAEPPVPASNAPLAAGLPHVKGRCPACGTAGLFLGDGGHATCSVRECPEPDAASTLLERKPAAPAGGADGLRARVAAALDNAHHTHPCPVTGSTHWTGCYHPGSTGPSCHTNRRTSAVLAALPIPADRTALLLELEAKYRGHARDEPQPHFEVAWAAVANDLRRMAGEAQQTGPVPLPFDYADDDTAQLTVSALVASGYYGDYPVVTVHIDEHQGDEHACVYVRPEHVEQIVTALRVAGQAAVALEHADQARQTGDRP